MMEPAPGFISVTATGVAGATGGTGNYTYQWTILSGNASISGSSTGPNITISAVVSKNISVSGTIRCRISDGVTSVNIDRMYSLDYYTNI